MALSYSHVGGSLPTPNQNTVETHVSEVKWYKLALDSIFKEYFDFSTLSMFICDLA